MQRDELRERLAIELRQWAEAMRLAPSMDNRMLAPCREDLLRAASLLSAPERPEPDAWIHPTAAHMVREGYEQHTTLRKRPLGPDYVPVSFRLTTERPTEGREALGGPQHFCMACGRSHRVAGPCPPATPPAPEPAVEGERLREALKAAIDELEGFRLQSHRSARQHGDAKRFENAARSEGWHDGLALAIRTIHRCAARHPEASPGEGDGWVPKRRDV